MTPLTKITDLEASHKTGIGASKVPTLAGLNARYGDTPLKLFRQILGLDPTFEGNEKTRWGHLQEDLILREWVEQAFCPVSAREWLVARLQGNDWGSCLSNTEARHPERPYMLAHADLVVEGPGGLAPWVCPKCGARDNYPTGTPSDCTAGCGQEITVPYRILVEAKNSGMMAAKRVEGEEFRGYDLDSDDAQGIPDKVYLQVQAQLYVYQAGAAFVAVLIDGNTWRQYGPILPDYRTQEKILALAERFWRLVEAKTPPAPETWDDVALLYPVVEPLSVTIGGDEETNARAMLAEYAVLGAKARQIDDRKKDIRNALGVLIGSNTELQDSAGNVLATVSERSRTAEAVFAREKDVLALTKKEKRPPTKDEKAVLTVAARVRKLGLVSVSKSRVIDVKEVKG